MWLFTKVGFFSIVASDVAGDVMVRTRFRKDLDRLRETYLPELGPTIARGSDYPYRAFVSKERFGEALDAMAQDIDYTNFKDQVTAEFGKARHDLYMQVWAILRCGSLKLRRRRP